MTQVKLFAAKYLNATTLRFIYILLALLALALAAGAPDALSGNG